MKASEILDYLKSLSAIQLEQTVDTFKIGNPEKEVKKAAVCFIATPNVIKSAVKWGADLLITHEPTYHEHFDKMEENPVTLAKKKLLEDSGLAVFRYHDHAHRALPDIIHKGFMDSLEKGYEMTGKNLALLDEEISPVALAELIEEKLDIKHVRIIGNRDFKSKRLGILLGACGDITHQLIKNGEADIVICGETCEWKCGEYVRDAGELGMPCAILVLGHAASERDGMKLVAKLVKDSTGVETKYFESGEIFTYTN